MYGSVARAPRRVRRSPPSSGSASPVDARCDERLHAHGSASPMAAPHLEPPGLLEAFLKNYPLGRLNTSEDIAAAAVFLGSDECYMTGQNLQVNGGLTLRRNPLPSEIEESVMAAMAAAQAE